MSRIEVYVNDKEYLMLLQFMDRHKIGSKSRAVKRLIYENKKLFDENDRYEAENLKLKTELYNMKRK